MKLHRVAMLMHATISASMRMALAQVQFTFTPCNVFVREKGLCALQKRVSLLTNLEIRLNNFCKF